MRIQFHKYHGAGNDFIVIDNRNPVFDKSDRCTVKKLCDRRFGIGADGLMLLQGHPDLDFEMIYFNSDGNEGTLCGNGGRCIISFAKYLNIIDDKTRFMAIDGVHDGVIKTKEYVQIKMSDVKKIEALGKDFFLNTGSPHYVVFCNNLKDLDVYEEGRKIRYNDKFYNEGTNVNFVEKDGNNLFVRTYERGVEDETFACGTGIVASAITAAHISQKHEKNAYNVKALGGKLKVEFKYEKSMYTEIWLSGPAVRVFDGWIELN